MAGARTNRVETRMIVTRNEELDGPSTERNHRHSTDRVSQVFSCRFDKCPLHRSLNNVVIFFDRVDLLIACLSTWVSMSAMPTFDTK